jgi:hypothetical protein
LLDIPLVVSALPHLADILPQNPITASDAEPHSVADFHSLEPSSNKPTTSGFTAQRATDSADVDVASGSTSALALGSSQNANRPAGARTPFKAKEPESRSVTALKEAGRSMVDTILKAKAKVEQRREEQLKEAQLKEQQQIREKEALRLKQLEDTTYQKTKLDALREAGRSVVDRFSEVPSLLRTGSAGSGVTKALPPASSAQDCNASVEPTSMSLSSYLESSSLPSTATSSTTNSPAPSLESSAASENQLALSSNATAATSATTTATTTATTNDDATSEPPPPSPLATTTTNPLASSAPAVLAPTTPTAAPTPTSRAAVSAQIQDAFSSIALSFSNLTSKDKDQASSKPPTPTSATTTPTPSTTFGLNLWK